MTQSRAKLYACGFAGLPVIPAAIWLDGTTAILLGGIIVVLALALADQYWKSSLLQRQLELAAVTDAATGALNAGAYQRTAQAADAIHVTVHLTDIDTLSEEYGWETTEAVLLHAADVLRDSVREEDIVGRLGESTFGLLINDVDPGIAERIAERAQLNLEQAPFCGHGHIIELSARAYLCEPAPMPPTLSAVTA